MIWQNSATIFPNFRTSFTGTFPAFWVGYGCARRIEIHRVAFLAVGLYRGCTKVTTDESNASSPVPTEKPQRDARDPTGWAGELIPDRLLALINQSERCVGAQWKQADLLWVYWAFNVVLFCCPLLPPKGAHRP
jgi:hypothetical protein